MVQNGHFWPKINVSAIFMKSGHRILVLQIWTVFWVYFWKKQVKVPGKIWFWPLCRFFVNNTFHVVTLFLYKEGFWSKIHCMWWQNGVFGSFWPISSNILMLYGQILLYEHYLLFINEKMNLKFWHQNFWPVLDLFW